MSKLDWQYPIRKRPREVPLSGPMQGPLFCIMFNGEWAPHVLGCLELLHHESKWAGDSSAIQSALYGVAEIMGTFGECGAEQGPNIVYEFRVIPVSPAPADYGRMRFQYRPVGSGGWTDMGDIDEALYIPTVSNSPLPNGDPSTTWFLDWQRADGTGFRSYTFQAPQGPAGADGAAGADGQDGQDGRDGVDGADGADGATGPAGPQGEEGPQGEQGPAGQDGAAGVDGRDGGHWYPNFYFDTVPRADGALPIHPSFQYRPIPDEYPDYHIIQYPTIDVLGSQGPQGEQGETGDTGADGAGKWWVPYTYQYMNGEVKVRWADGDGVPAYDPNDPTTYLETAHNIRGPAGLRGATGATGGYPIIPATTQWAAFCYAAKLYAHAMATWLNGTFFAYEWALDILESLIDEAPFFSILGAAAEIIHQPLEDTMLVIVNEQNLAEARDLIYCRLLDSNGFTDTELQGWATDIGDVGSALIAYGPAGITYWGFLIDAALQPSRFRQSLAEHAAMSVALDFRECEDSPCTPEVTRWYEEFDFTAGDGDWFAYVSYSGNYQLDGWHEGQGNIPLISGNPNKAGCLISRNFASSGSFDKIGVGFEYDPASGDRNCIIRLGSTILQSWTLTSYGAGSYVLEWTPADFLPRTGNALTIGIGASTNGDTTGRVTIKKVYMSGPNLNPV